jgi:hypothetical protein
VLLPNRESGAVLDTAEGVEIFSINLTILFLSLLLD